MAYKLKIQRSYHLLEETYENLDEAVRAAEAQAGAAPQPMVVEDDKGEVVLEWDALKERIDSLRASKT